MNVNCWILTMRIKGTSKLPHETCGIFNVKVPGGSPISLLECDVNAQSLKDLFSAGGEKRGGSGIGYWDGQLRGR
jgi:hypothetical protein